MSAGLVDRTVVAVFKAGRRPKPPDEVRRILAEATAALTFYEVRGWLDDPSTMFAAPGPPGDASLIRQRRSGLAYEHLSFESGYEPQAGEPGRDRWLARQANRTAHAWIVRHREPRPWLVCIHGAGMGYPSAEFSAFRASWLHDELGLNLAFPVLPLHGPRRDGWGVVAAFPGDEPLDSIHAVAQAVWDVRRVIGWIHAQGDHTVGLSGLSLGGYISAVVAGVEDGVACVIAGIPAVDFAELTTGHAPSRFLRRSDYRALSDMGPNLYRVISPLVLTPRVPRERRFIFAALADRVVPPERQAARLWAHWDKPRICWFNGGHVGFLRSPQVRAFVQEALARSGLIDDDWLETPP